MIPEHNSSSEVDLNYHQSFNKLQQNFPFLHILSNSTACFPDSGLWWPKGISEKTVLSNLGIGDMVCALKGKIVLGVYPPLLLFHFSSTLQSSQEWHIIIFQNIFWHIDQVITATSFSNLVKYIFIFLNVLLLSFFPWCFAFPFNAVQPYNSLLSIYKLCLSCPGIQCSNPTGTWQRHSTLP